MPKENEILPLFDNCWHELQRLHRNAAALKNACATNERFLTGTVAGAFSAFSLADADHPHSHSQSWRRKAEQVRELAHRVTVATAKPLLLEIADTYDRLQD